jgi:thiosulfate/3-mercaptopyruvate sulfurtransferase
LENNLKKNLNSINHVHHLQDILLFFFSAHIPQARYFDQLEYTTPTKYIPRGIPEIKSFESYLSRLGVSNTDHIVLYDRSPMGLLASSRAWWLLKVCILVFILNFDDLLLDVWYG